MTIKSKMIRFNKPNILLGILILIVIIFFFKNNCFIIPNDTLINLTGYNSILSGFLFTALSVLISALSNDRIARLKKYNYLNKYYFAIIFSLIVSVIALLLNFLYLYIDVKLLINYIYFIQKVVITLTFISSVYFIQAIYYIIKLLKKLH